MKDDRVAFITNNAAFFTSHRLPLAIGARQTGYVVGLFTGQAGSVELEGLAIKVLKLNQINHKKTVWRTSGLNPFIEIIGLLQLIFFLTRFKPTIVHCASPKGVLYGGIAARICRVPYLVMAISGMGYAYTKSSETNVVRELAKLVYSMLRFFAFKHPNLRVIVQNEDDKYDLNKSGLVDSSNVILIPGSGVDLELYSDGYEGEFKKPIVLFPARMLKDKGVIEFIDAARQVKKIEPNWRFILAGAANYDNPSSINEVELKLLCKDSAMEWLGHVENMVPLYKDAAIVCLPSYREGMPKSLLEAAAAGCAVITTNVTGCREAVDPGITGDLVPVGDSDALAAAMLSLIRDNARRINYSINARKRAIDLYSLDLVVKKVLNLYKGFTRE
jgi:glycosyltransferase involved in cell wall biosynthesis